MTHASFTIRETGLAPRRLAALAAALAAASLATAARAITVRESSSAGAGGAGVTAHLAGTGLYADPAVRTIRADQLAYAPQYPLWSDGAAKRRWIHLPPGAAIDASDPDAWRFPVGTRLWKEFAFAGRRVETRYMERRPDGWIFATYVWNDEGTDAVLAPARSIPDAHPIRPGVRHDIPGTSDCHACHDGRPSPVLGFTALQLSTDRDPLAAHAEPRSPGLVDLADLARRGLVRGAAFDPARPPRIAARTPVARAALGYLQANCGICHNARGPLASAGLALDHDGAALADDAPALRTAVGRTSRFGGGVDAGAVRIAPGAPERSTIVQRMASLDPNALAFRGLGASGAFRAGARRG